MKWINWKILNSALWIEILLAYILPFKVSDNFHYEVGFPMSFITVYNKEIIGVNPFSSMLLEPIALIINVLIIYYLIIVCKRIYEKIKSNK